MERTQEISCDGSREPVLAMEETELCVGHECGQVDTTETACEARPGD